MPGAELFFLNAAQMRRNLSANHFAVGRGNNDNLLYAHLFQRVYRMANHRLAGQRHHYLGQVGLHAGALAGTQNNRGDLV